MSLAIGIDLGTTNSVAAIATPTGVRLAVGTDGEPIHPSVVSFPQQGGMLVGFDAKECRATDPENTIYSAKRLIGQNMQAPMVQLALTAMPFHVEEGPNSQPIVVVRGRRMTIPEVSARVLGHLKMVAENQFGDEVDEVVLTVPANFTDAQRKATKEAGVIAGLNVLRLVNEPTAAALAYGYGQSLDQVITVFDFGGGTFDVSVLKISSDIFEVLATDGDFFLGGDDVDRALAEYLAAELNRTQGVDPRPFPEAMTRLTMAAEQIKCYLSEAPEASGTIDGILAGDGNAPLALPFHMTVKQFERLIEGYVDKTLQVCSQVVHAAGMEPKDIGDIILVGGSTRIPMIRQRVAELFGREASAKINPDEVVAHGAAIQASMLSGSFTALPEESPAVAAQSQGPVFTAQEPGATPAKALLLDVTPAALSIATVGGYAERLLEKNAPIPIEHTKIFTTAHDGQTRVVIDCCRGEARRFEENEPLGTLVLEELPDAPRGEAKVEVTFRVDTDGLLHVRAVDVRTGKNQEAKLNVIGAPVEASDSA